MTTVGSVTGQTFMEEKITLKLELSESLIFSIIYLCNMLQYQYELAGNHL